MSDHFIRIRRKDLIDARKIVMAGPARDIAARLTEADGPLTDRQFDQTVYVLGLRELTRMTKASQAAISAATNIVERDGKREHIVSAELLREKLREAGYNRVADMITDDLTIPGSNNVAS